jgi:hypothetical protein
MSRTVRSPIARRTAHRRARSHSIDLLEAARLIWTIGYELAAHPNGTHPTPWATALSHRLRYPEIGDLVIETSSWNRRGAVFDQDRVGWLVDYGFDREQHPDGYPVDRPNRPDWHLVQPLVQPRARTPRTVRWANASFYAVPTDRSAVWPTAGGTISDRAGVIVARQDRARRAMEFGALIIDPASAVRVTDIS